jgi:hypothetical protein
MTQPKQKAKTYFLIIQVMRRLPTVPKPDPLSRLPMATDPRRLDAGAFDGAVGTMHQPSKTGLVLRHGTDLADYVRRGGSELFLPKVSRR